MLSFTSYPTLLTSPRSGSARICFSLRLSRILSISSKSVSSSVFWRLLGKPTLSKSMSAISPNNSSAVLLFVCTEVGKTSSMGCRLGVSGISSVAFDSTLLTVSCFPSAFLGAGLEKSRLLLAWFSFFLAVFGSVKWSSQLDLGTYLCSSFF